ncbi:MAG TPA: LacI family DNA-binding transcriptional regulator [Chloroflexota bacterium]|nr:LacI family DNA-binding transcriptional regulator [Chloroflexota bacterium]
MATLKDVAERAGLSVAAASLALSGSTRIPDVTRRRVQDAAAALGYTPNASARALRSKRHGAIGLLMFGPGSGEPLTFYGEAVVAVADEALRTERQLVLLGAHARPAAAQGGERSSRGRELARLLASARVDGAVCIGTDVTAEDVRVMERRGFPYLFIGKRVLPGVTVPYVATDYLDAGRVATDHLLSLGHRRVAVAVTPHERYAPWNVDRVAGHSVAIGACSGASGPILELPLPAPEHAHLARAWLEEGITAVFATGPQAASRLLGLCQLAGLRVPTDLALVAFDDHPGASLMQPPLTVMRQPLASLGTLAARTLLARLEGAPHEPVSAALPATLVVRESCGAHLTRHAAQEMEAARP